MPWADLHGWPVGHLYADRPLALQSMYLSGADCGGAINSGDYNLIRDPFGCTVNGTAVDNISNQDPVLGALADNGGSTWTMALQVGSPAIESTSTVTLC